MKNIIAALAGFLVCASAFAEAPELRQKLPTEWRHMERIGEGATGSLEMARIGWGDKLYGSLKESRYGSYIKNLDPENFLSCSVFYKEIVGADEFYWQVAYPETKYPFPNRPAAVIGLYYKKDGHLVFFGYCLSDFCVTVVAQHTEDMGLQYRANTFQIIKGRNGAKGVVFYENFTGLNDDMTFKATMKGAVYGGSDAEYYLLDTCITEDFRLNGRNSISIKCSDFLWDERYPLRYSLQNAFDGDPATSYVENTEDDLMRITFRRLNNIRTNLKTTFAIINGYAANKDLYAANNRIRKCGIENNEDSPFIAEIDDNIMSRQIKTINRPEDAYTGLFVFVVTDIYKGSKYNDTCIAELNFYDNMKKIWFFGDIDE